MKRAIITGASGQDAYYLSLLLLEKGYKVVATSRRVARPQAPTVLELLEHPNYSVVSADITDISSMIRIIKEVNPDEFYHLAAQSEVGTSYDQPIATYDITYAGTMNCLEALRMAQLDTKFYFAGSSEQFGDVHGGVPLNEDSPMIPRSPYAIAKLAGYHLTRVYRKSYDMFACCGILFNHESPQRKPYFVTRKITLAAARIARGEQAVLELGNITSGRDWGHSKDYMRAAWMMLQHDTPDDYVVATEEFHTITDVLDIAFTSVALNWKDFVKHDTPDNVRPHDVTRLLGDATKIKTTLGWKPEISFSDLISEMVSNDYQT